MNTLFMHIITHIYSSVYYVAGTVASKEVNYPRLARTFLVLELNVLCFR